MENIKYIFFIKIKINSPPPLSNRTMGAGTTVKLSFVKFPTVKYNIRENTNREIIINICII